MGSDDLESLAFSSMTTNISSSQGTWDFHNLGFLNSDISQFLYMDGIQASDDNNNHEYDSSSDYSSTGYLEDVLFGFKRRRLLYADNHSDNSIRNHWASNIMEDYCLQDFDSLSQIIMTNSDTNNSEMKSPEEETFSETHDSSSETSQKQLTDTHYKATSLHCIHPIFSSGAKEKRKKRVLAKVVYPFAVVKPGGFEGDMTLNDINERILMPPTRPVRHPVGDFACRPLVSPNGPGLFGKAVIAFTRIHTQGKGTITIIRTRT